MAQGDTVLFNKFVEDMGDKLYNLSGDTFKLALVKSSANGGIDPTATTADPRWGAGGTTNLLSSEVTPGGNYTTGGESLSTTITDNWTISSNVSKFDGDDVSIASNASNPTNARWGIVYDDTDAGKRAIGYVDLGSDSDLSGGNFTLAWNASGIFTLTRN